MSILGWFSKYEAVAVWLEGLALVAIFIWDRIDASRDHRETLAQLEIAQDQIRISQNAERAWILTELEWRENDSIRIMIGTSKVREEPEVETTDVLVRLTCRNEGRSPAWVDKIQGYAEIVNKRLRDLPPPIGHEAQPFPAIGPIAPGKVEARNLEFMCRGHLKETQLVSIFVLVEYRDIFEARRVTTCGYTISGKHLSRQDDLPDRNRNT
jgi:hypothetical protein